MRELFSWTYKFFYRDKVVLSEIDRTFDVSSVTQSQIQHRAMDQSSNFKKIAAIIYYLERHQSQLITILFASHRLLGTITFVFGQILSNYLSLGRCWVKTLKPHLGTQDSIHRWGSLCSGNRRGSHTPHLHTRRFPYRTRTGDMALGSTCLCWRRPSHFLCRCLN